MWRNFGFNEGTHIHKQLSALESGADVFDLAYGYVHDSPKHEVELCPLDLSFCYERSLAIKYSALAHTNVMQGIIKTAQLMALKAYIGEIKNEEHSQAAKVLLYGVGYGAEQILNSLPSNAVDIRAYIDSDVEIQFRMYHRKLVIPPDYVRFFEFDYIVITSQNYFDEMRETLLGFGIDEEQICTPVRLMDVLEE